MVDRFPLAIAVAGAFSVAALISLSHTYATPSGPTFSPFPAQVRDHIKEQIQSLLDMLEKERMGQA